MKTKFSITKSISFLTLLFILAFNNVNGQTPGLIYEPATGAGITVLDPNGDGFTSATTAGFATDDQAQSEIPYKSLVFPMVEPTSDLGPGPDCGFTDFVDQGDEDPVQAYLNGNNWLFRMRMGKTAPNAKSYSILIDTDGKFGGTGPNKDPQYSSSNPGFEIEIVLATKFGVFVYDVNNMNCSPVISYNDPLNLHYQKSIALTTNCGDPDYFYDFYVNFSDLASQFSITNTTPVRMAIVDNMAANKSTICNFNSASDLAGIDDASCGNNLENCFGDIIDNYTPCAPGVICPDRSLCPGISSVNIGATSVSGTSTEANGTVITVYKDGVSIGTTAVSAGVWTLSGIAPALASGQVISATATAPGKGVSIANCNPITVAPSCTSQTSTTVTISKISGGKGFDIVNSFPIGTIFTWYNSDFTVAQIASGFGGNIPNPVTITTANQLVSFECKTGQCFNSGMYYFTFKEPNKCVSSYLSSCLYAVSGTTGNPSFTSSTITTATTSISGTVASPDNVSGIAIYLNSNGTQIGTATTTTGGNWTISGLSLSSRECQTLSVTAVATGKCVSTGVVNATITRKAYAPVINGPICSTVAITSVSGSSNEVAGTTIQVFENGILEGSTTVAANSTWSVSSGISIAIGSTISAKALGTCLSLSDASNSVLVGTLTTNAVTITPNPIIENTTSVSGKGTAGNTIKLYIDGYPVFQDLAETILATGTVDGSGDWTISTIFNKSLYAGGTLTATATSGTNCEGVLSDPTPIVCLLPLKNLTVNPDNTTVCSGSIVANVQVVSSQAGVIYQIFNNTLSANSGSSVLGTGGTITLSSAVLTANATLSVRAIKTPFGSCTETLDETVTVTVNAVPNLSLTVGSDATSICGNTSTNIRVALSQVGFNYQLRNNSDNSNVGSVIAGIGGTISLPTGILSTTTTFNITATGIAPSNCTGQLTATKTINVIAAPTVATSANSSRNTFCSDDAGTINLSVTGGSGSLVTWFTSSCGGTAVGTGNPLIIASPAVTTTYYARWEDGLCYSACQDVTVTVTAPASAGTLSGTQSICISGNTTYSSTVTGGAFTSSDTSKATVHPSTGVITGVASGTATITYTVTGTGGCSDATATRTVTVTAPASAGTLSGTQNICISGNTTYSSTVTGG
ncbi:Ig-like domain-containing protein, partial [Flavobacterium xinjiangense]